MPELAGELEAHCGARADPASLSRWLIRNGYRYKKNPAGQRMRSSRHPPGARGMDGSGNRERLEPHRLIFLDETGTTTKMTRLRGRSLKGQRLRAKAPFGHWKTQTFIAGLRCSALTAPSSLTPQWTGAFSKPMSKPNSPPPSKTATSSSWTICRLIKADRQKGHSDRAHGFCSSAYSPDLNPIEMAFAKLKAHPARQSRKDNRRPCAPSAKSATSFNPTMQEQLHRRRLWIQLIVRCSSAPPMPNTTGAGLSPGPRRAVPQKNPAPGLPARGRSARFGGGANKRATRRQTRPSARLFLSTGKLSLRVNLADVVAFALKAHKVCGQEPAHFVLEKIAIQSARKTKGDLLTCGAPVAFRRAFARDVSLAEVRQSPQAFDQRQVTGPEGCGKSVIGVFGHGWNQHGQTLIVPLKGPTCGLDSPTVGPGPIRLDRKLVNRLAKGGRERRFNEKEAARRCRGIRPRQG